MRKVVSRTRAGTKTARPARLRRVTLGEAGFRRASFIKEVRASPFEALFKSLDHHYSTLKSVGDLLLPQYRQAVRAKIGVLESEISRRLVAAIREKSFEGQSRVLKLSSRIDEERLPILLSQMMTVIRKRH